jgi:hypothetical protein
MDQVDRGLGSWSELGKTVLLAYLDFPLTDGDKPTTHEPPAQVSRLLDIINRPLSDFSILKRACFF